MVNDPKCHRVSIALINGTILFEKETNAAENAIKIDEYNEIISLEIASGVSLFCSYFPISFYQVLR